MNTSFTALFGSFTALFMLIESCADHSRALPPEIIVNRNDRSRFFFLMGSDLSIKKLLYVDS